MQELTKSVEDLTKKVAQLEAEVERIRSDYSSQELLMQGLKSGAKGVIGAFILLGFVFLVNASFYYIKDKQLLSPGWLVLLSAIIAFAWLAYFGGIFGYVIWARVKTKTHDVGAGTQSAIR